MADVDPETLRNWIGRVLAEHTACSIPDCTACSRTVGDLVATSIHNPGGTMTDVPAADLARELNLPVAELLARADKLIGDVVRRDGLDAARGLTTHMQGSKVVLTPRLADALRGKST